MAAKMTRIRPRLAPTRPKWERMEVMLDARAPALAVAWVLAAAGAAGQDGETEAPSHGRRPGLRASIDPVLDRLEQEAIEQGVSADPRNPFRFSTSIEVRARTPEQLLARFLDGPDDRLARPPHSPPSARELDRFRALPPQPDFVGLAREVVKWLGRKGEPHYFLYRVTRDGRSSALLRETRLPADLLVASPTGAVFEPVGQFASRDDAVAAYERLQDLLAREEEALEAAREATVETEESREEREP